MVEKPDCNHCQKLLELYNEEPDCTECMPNVMAENDSAFRIYELVEDQVIIAGMSGEIVALMNGPIWEAIDRFREQVGIDNDLECFSRVKKIASIVQEEQRKKRPEK